MMFKARNTDNWVFFPLGMSLGSKLLEKVAASPLLQRAPGASRPLWDLAGHSRLRASVSSAQSDDWGVLCFQLLMLCSGKHLIS